MTRIRIGAKAVFYGRLARWLGGLRKNPYQPERHYMPGPGPATLKKQTLRAPARQG